MLFNFSIKANINEKLQAEIIQQIKEGIPQWMLDQIAENLLFAPEKITKDMIKNTLKQDRMCLMLFRIKDGKIEREYNPITTLQAQIDASEPIFKALTELNSYIPLPNIEFIYSIDDAPSSWPNICQFKNRPTTRYPVPVFAPCKHINDINVLVIPDSHSLTAIYGNLYEELLLGNSKYPWHMKKNKAFWRGATTGGLYRDHNYNQFPRVKLVKISSEYPSLLDAKFHRLWELPVSLCQKFAELNYIGNNTSIADHIKYKYQILIDGNSASWPRAYWQFQCNSVVFKQNSNFILWHNNLFKPWVHYIPFEYDCSDLIETINWVIGNDEYAQKIAQNANDIAHSCLKYSDILLYFYAVITEYAKHIADEN
jgi:hypothetical protein